jgi:hypothetical protein
MPSTRPSSGLAGFPFDKPSDPGHINTAITRRIELMSDYSKDPTVLEYTAQSMIKGKSLTAAIKASMKTFHGHTNMFVGSGDNITINEDILKEAMWERLVGVVTANISRIKPGKEHYALDGTLQQFSQKPSMRAELKKRVIKAVGTNPFPNDDV